MKRKYRNPVYTAAGTIDCEVEHPKLGWIPFTASSADPEKHGRDLFAAIEKAGGVRPYAPPEGGADAEGLAAH